MNKNVVERNVRLCLRASARKFYCKPAVDAARFGRVWDEVHALKDAYEMNP
ncbi:MAG: hypothetical protein QMD04_13690 [Anaerolineales bacterium]|nr:hypothetical protein [Anaerolineales bacterium]